MLPYFFGIIVSIEPSPWHFQEGSPWHFLHVKLLFAELLKLSYDILIIYKNIPTKENPEELDIENINPYEEECKLFVESVNKGQENDLLSAQAAIDAITIYLKAKEALEKGKEVFIG